MNKRKPLKTKMNKRPKRTFERYGSDHTKCPTNGKFSFLTEKAANEFKKKPQEETYG